MNGGAVGYGLGVDLGTSSTGVAIGRHGRTRIVPLSDDPISHSALVTVRPAGSLQHRETDDTVPVSLGGRPYPGVAVLARTLTSVLQAVTAAEGEPPERVVLTCPAVWGPTRRQQFGEVSRRAGLNSVTMVSEPEAAVASMVEARRLGVDDVVVVYDLGGVTVDLTVVRVNDSGMEILGLPETLEGAGGADFDDLILTHVDGAVHGALSRLDLSDPVAAGVLVGARAECVRAKETLSRSRAATVRVVGLNGEVTGVGLSRAQFEAMIQGPLKGTLSALRRVLGSAGVRAGDLAGVVLVGGSSRIPLISQLLARSLGRPILTDEHPQHCIALGAAVIANGSSIITDGARTITPGVRPITNGMPTIAAAAAATAASSAGPVAAEVELPPLPGAQPQPPGLPPAAGTGRRTPGPASATIGAALGSMGLTEPGRSTKPAGTAGPPGRTGAGPAPSTAPIALPPGAVSPGAPGAGGAPGGRPATGALGVHDLFASASTPATRPGFQPTLTQRPDLPPELVIGELTTVDITTPSLSRRAGGHRMPRMGDWRRRAGVERHGADDGRWRVIGITALAVITVIGAAYVISPRVSGPAGNVSVTSSTTPRPSGSSTRAPVRPSTTAQEPGAAGPATVAASRTAAPTDRSRPPASDRPSAPKPPKAPKPPAGPKQPVIVVPVTGAGALVGLAGKCLDLVDGRTDDGTGVQLFTCNKSQGQLWTATGDKQLMNQGKCLTVVDPAPGRGHLELSTCYKRKTQEWLVGSGLVVNPPTARCLDIEGPSSADRSPAIVADCNGSAGQGWKLRF
jgi:molecular chaperone DnaK